MSKRFLVFLILSCTIGQAAENRPSEASIKELLGLAQAHKLVDTLILQMDNFTKNALEQATKGQTLSPNVQKDVDKHYAEMMSIIKEELSWEKMEPLYLQVYQQSFTQQEIDGMIAFYKTPTGQMLLNKMPVVMQNTMVEMQKRTGPMIQRIERLQQDVIAEIKADKPKDKGS